MDVCCDCVSLYGVDFDKVVIVVVECVCGEVCVRGDGGVDWWFDWDCVFICCFVVLCYKGGGWFDYGIGCLDGDFICNCWLCCLNGEFVVNLGIFVGFDWDGWGGLCCDGDLIGFWICFDLGCFFDMYIVLCVNVYCVWCVFGVDFVVDIDVVGGD